MMKSLCSVWDITWGLLGYQCLNCGAQADHSWNLHHTKVETK